MFYLGRVRQFYMTYEEALQYIHSVSWMGSRPGLTRIAELCDKLGNPEKSLICIHVAGTNGKGSVCSMLSSILTEAGYNTGLYTSPFVERFNERIMRNNRDISDDELAEVTEYVRAAAETMEDSPTEFELITAIAFEYYKRKGCDYVVLETGLGGRLDSTNIIENPVLSIITGIDLDHTALLGNTTAEIAAEKAGIIKPGRPILFGEGDADAERVIRETASRVGSEYYRTDFSKISDIKTDLNGTEFNFGDRHTKIKLCGIYQTRNTATVLTACDILKAHGVDIPEKAIDAGLIRARWKARFEVLSNEPLIIYDGAHNPQGIAGAVENIRCYLSDKAPDGQVVLLMGVMADKAHEKMIGMLSPLVSSVYCVTPSNSRSLPSVGVEREFEEFGVRAYAFDNLHDGVIAAAEAARTEGRPLVCLGSLYMYADVLHAVNDYIAEQATSVKE